MQFSLRLVLEVTVVCAAFLATVFVWGFVGFFVISLLLAVISASHQKWLASIFFATTTGALFSITIGVQSVPTARNVGRRIQCASNLSQLAQAILRYHSVHGEFPPAYTVDPHGNRLHSWRTLILPYLYRQDVYDKIRLNEPWNSPYNSQFHSVQMRIFECPDRHEFGRRPCTHYVAVVGRQTACPISGDRSIDDIDDPENTIMLVEVENPDIHWMEPRDLEFNQMSMQVNHEDGRGISGRHLTGKKRGLVGLDIWKPGAYVAFADGHVEFFPVDTPPDKIRPMLLIKKKTD